MRMIAPPPPNSESARPTMKKTLMVIIEMVLSSWGVFGLSRDHLQYSRRDISWKSVARWVLIDISRCAPSSGLSSIICSMRTLER